MAIKDYTPADTLVLDDVAHFCWSDVFGGDTVAPGESFYLIISSPFVPENNKHHNMHIWPIGSQSCPSGIGKVDLGMETKR